MIEIRHIEHSIQKDVNERDYFLNNKMILEKQIAIQIRELENANEARSIIQQASKEMQEQLRFQINNIVSSALEAVFEESYAFEIQFIERRNKIEADLIFIKNGVSSNPVDVAGGGVLDVASFSLRLTYWFLKGSRAVMILDEPFRFVSVDIQPFCSAMVKMLSEKLKLQIIMISHLPNIIDSADKIFTVSNGNIVKTIPEEIINKVERIRILKPEIERVKIKKE